MDRLLVYSPSNQDGIHKPQLSEAPLPHGLELGQGNDRATVDAPRGVTVEAEMQGKVDIRRSRQ